jgi:hypothetical protein
MPRVPFLSLSGHIVFPCVSFFLVGRQREYLFFLGGGRELGVCGVEALDGPRL